MVESGQAAIVAGCKLEYNGHLRGHSSAGWNTVLAWPGYSSPMNISLLDDAIEIRCAGFHHRRLSSCAVVLYQGEENTRRHEEAGEVVLVTEHRVLDSGARKGHIVIRVSLYLLQLYIYM